MNEIQQRVEEAKLSAFLKRTHALTEGSPARLVPAGDLGEQLGLPYEEALRLTGRLARRGLVRPAGPLQPPHGPRIQLTRRGTAWVRARAA